jgi:hypothetical protein
MDQKTEKNEKVTKKPEKLSITYQKIPEKSNSCFLTSENSFRVFPGSFDNLSSKYATILTHFTEKEPIIKPKNYR